MDRHPEVARQLELGGGVPLQLGLPHEQRHVHRKAPAAQLAGHREAVAAVVAGPARDHHPLRIGEALGHHLGDRARGGLHQDHAGKPQLAYGHAVGFAHLAGIEHRDHRTLLPHYPTSLPAA